MFVYRISDFDKELLMQPICSIDLIHLNIDKYKNIVIIHVHGICLHLTWVRARAVDAGPLPGTQARCGPECIDMCIFVYFHVLGLYSIWVALITPLSKFVKMYCY